MTTWKFVFEIYWPLHTSKHSVHLQNYILQQAEWHLVLAFKSGVLPNIQAREMNLLMTSEFGKTQKFFHGKSFFQLLWHKLGQGDTISQKAELFLNAMAWKRISLRGAKFSHDCLFVHQCSLAELPISNFTMLCYYAMIIGACCFRFGLRWTFPFGCWFHINKIMNSQR